jgi:hypothetical protein
MKSGAPTTAVSWCSRLASVAAYSYMPIGCFRVAVVVPHDRSSLLRDRGVFHAQAAAVT